jgi:hypothetical protein
MAIADFTGPSILHPYLRAGPGSRSNRDGPDRVRARVTAPALALRLILRGLVQRVRQAWLLLGLALHLGPPTGHSLSPVGDDGRLDRCRLTGCSGGA